MAEDERERAADWASYAGRMRDLAEQAVRVNTEMAERWATRALHDDEWSMDTVTADAIEAWEHLTPLAEQGIELWLQAVQQAVRPPGQS